MDKTASASADVVDVLILDGNNRVTYSVKNSEFAAGTLELTKTGSEKKYLASAEHPDAVFQYVKSEEFMLNSILNKDFGKIRFDYDDDSAFESGLAQKSIYMLSRIGVHGSACHAVLLRLLGTDRPVDVSGCGGVQAGTALLGLDRIVYQPDWSDRLQNLQAQHGDVHRLRCSPKCRPPVLLCLRRAARHPL